MTGTELQLEFDHATLTDLIYRLRTEPFSGVTVVDVFARFADDPGSDKEVLATQMPSVQIVGFWETARAFSINAGNVGTADAAIGALLSS